MREHVERAAPASRVTAPAESEHAGGARGGRGWTSRLPGLGLALAVALAAGPIGGALPLIGGPVSGMVIGVLPATVVRPGPRLRPGLDVSGQPTGSRS